MSLSQLVSPHLPYLRRFARALAGSQHGGDAYAIAALEAITTDTNIIRQAEDPRLALFRTLVGIWNRVPGNGHMTPPPSYEAAGQPSVVEHNAQQTLGAITSRPRIAFLLFALEGFTAQEITAVLDCNEGEVSELLATAGREIAAQIASDVLIIEDEPIIAMDIEALVEGLGHRVTNIARTHQEALAAIKERKPGLVLADIQLADGSSGLDAVNDILKSITIPVIFITAYPERLLTGERPEPAFLITKPFSEDAVRAVISQALFFGHASKPADHFAATSA